ncbi:MAG: NAD(P)H-hydrate epimerase [Candidatus Nanohaloarchaea archaeon]
MPVVDEPGGGADAVIDALIGYSLDGAPRPPFDDLVQRIDAADATTVSVDVPSGVDADTGEGLQPHVAADHTVTLALPFQGFQESEAVEAVRVADISVPPQVYDRFGIDARGVFETGSLVRYR